MSFEARFDMIDSWDDDDLYFQCPYQFDCKDCEYDCEDKEVN